MSELKKALFTLNLNPKEYDDITSMTYPLLKHYARKIGAEFVEITERKFPDWPPNYEKVQVFQLGQEMKNDWNIFFDADALVHPNTPDFTEHLGKDTVAHNGTDFASFRFKYDRFYRRDGRNLGSASWLCMASDWCIEMFEPCELSPAWVESMIFPTTSELQNGVTPIRLVEDFIFGRNIAKYGLKLITIKDLSAKLGIQQAQMFFHLYALPKLEKIVKMAEICRVWGFDDLAIPVLKRLGVAPEEPKQPGTPEVVCVQ